MRFELLEPASLEEALNQLEEIGPDTRILAGGTDLLIKIKRGLLKPNRIVSLQKISELNKLNYDEGNELFIGALVNHARVAENENVREKFPALAQACSVVGSPQIRNLGTIVGNIVNASPAADTAPALLALGAVLVIRDKKGVRQLPLNQFFLGPMKTTLGAGQIVEGIIIPEPLANTFSTYIKLGRRKSLEISICSVAIAAKLQKDRWSNVQLAMGAVAPVPLLEAQSANILNDKIWAEDIIKEAGQIAAMAASPIDDQRASADYRQSMIEVLVKRCAERLSLKALGGEANA